MVYSPNLCKKVGNQLKEILFRAKSLRNNAWVYGYYNNCCWLGCNINQTKDYIMTTLGIMHEIDRNTLGQYSCFLDSNDKKIFEGDIIRYCDRLSYDCFEESIHYPEYYDGEVYDPNFRYGLIVYETEAFSGFDIASHDFDCNGLSELICSGDYYYEVVGNIYDNPELLRGGKL